MSLTLGLQHISKAVSESTDGGETLDLTKWSFTEVSDSSAVELARVGAKSSDEAGIVTRVALSNNLLTSLPKSFQLLIRLRYLNLRQNSFENFPDVLTMLPSLEILDISRNRIAALPLFPGKLINLRVFSLARNQLMAVPTYITKFHNLRVLKLDSNPIVWPPPDIWRMDHALDDNDEGVRSWLANLQSWIATHAGEVQPFEDAEYTSDDEVVIARSQLVQDDAGNGVLLAHGRSQSLDLASSTLPSILPVSHQEESIFQLQSPTKIDEDPAVHRRSRSSPSMTQHIRGSSHNTPDTRSRRSSSQFSHADQSYRDAHGFTAEDPDFHVDTETAHIDSERNRYFRRISKLHGIDTNLSPSLQYLVDSIRGILFSLTQIYSAVRNYAVSAVDERVATALSKVLNPTNSFLSDLINALDVFDATTASKGWPFASDLFLLLMESCLENLTVFGKVMSVLQLQLKVLSSSHDPRYTRTLLLMLYGSAAEISNSWLQMSPHLGVVRSVLRDARTKTQPETQQPIFDSGAAVAHISTGPSPARYRRHAGSFSSNDVQIGRHLPSRQDTSDSPVPPLNPPPSRTLFRKSSLSNVSQSGSTPFPLNNEATHSRGTSQSSTASFSFPSPSFPTSSSASPPLLAPRNAIRRQPAARQRSDPLNELATDPAKLVDRDLANTLEMAAQRAKIVWDLIDVALTDEPDGDHESLLGNLEKVKSTTSKILDHLSNSRYDDTGEFSKGVGEDTHTFVKIGVQILMQLKILATSRPLSDTLRHHVADLALSLQEVTAFLHVSSFAPATTPRPFSPSFDRITGDRPAILANGVATTTSKP
ncbi:RAM signaling pathway protein-domain-containing protein [Cantharellus anzutake]|uniref:RAM signaling pathway protein-domain-containing protein n=1 Tax=Cantharellus anzutake TaxID=1750568 RepID=UPI001908F161|nr:RAM signaling pathway protein-domain-containing protein [Cantharellus anzutake]KAF8343937.1 RAM signaling pathway protein-domain-containing protein [Cantharellus anzutake]